MSSGGADSASAAASSSGQWDDSFATRGHSASIAELGDTLSLDSLPVRAVEYPAGFRGKSRRSSVSAESDRPAAGSGAQWPQRVVPKNAEAMQRLRAATEKSILFSGLDEQQKTDIYNSMEEVKVKEGDIVIRQGEEGDYFYVIDSGVFNVYKSDSAEPAHAELNDGLGPQVFQYETQGSFGELALLYNCPRAATVRAAEPGVLWRTDRETFRSIIIDSTARKRRQYESFLETVPLLSSLSRGERSQLADCLESVTFEPGAQIITQGDVGDKLYLIMDGQACATQCAPGASQETVEVGRMGTGQYFGERSLLLREPRAANVLALTHMTCASIDRAAFERLLGPLKDLMKSHAAQYARAEDILRAKSVSPVTSPNQGASAAAAASASASAAMSPASPPSVNMSQ